MNNNNNVQNIKKSNNAEFFPFDSLVSMIPLYQLKTIKRKSKNYNKGDQVMEPIMMDKEVLKIN